MNAVIPFAFEEQLVRVVKRGDEPWFVGKDVCQCLGIKNTKDALSSLNDDEKGVATTDPLSRGGEQVVVIVSEPGVYQLVFRSRKPQAHRFRRWLSHEVIPSIRRNGHYSPGGGDQAPKPEARYQPQTYGEALETVRLIRMTHGREAARRAWSQLGLPAVPPAPVSATDEGRECLDHLLAAQCGALGTVAGAIEAAMRECEAAVMDLEETGLRLVNEGECLFVPNWHERIAEIYAGTGWTWHLALRQLPGTTVSPGGLRIRGVKHRGTLIPIRELRLAARVQNAA